MGGAAERGERRPTFLSYLALLLTTVLLVAGPASAARAEAGTVAESPAAETETSPASSDDSSDSEEDGDDQPGLAVGILLLGALGLGVGYLFYDRWRSSYQKLALAALEKTGHVPHAEWNPAESAQAGVAGIAPAEAQPQPTITGPTAIVVGQPNTYTATQDGAPLESCVWTVEPEGAAAVAPATGGSVTVTATKEGTFTLKASSGGGTPTLAQIAALSAEAKEGSIPLLGFNFAGLAAVIIAVSIAGMLAVVKILGADAFIAFIGPIVGYFFAQAHDSSAGSNSSGGAPTGGSPQS